MIAFYVFRHSTMRLRRTMSTKNRKAQDVLDELKLKLENAFTEEKLQIVFKLISQIGDELSTHLLSIKKELSCIVDVRELVETFAIDTIARVIYGIEAHTVNQPDSTYRMHKGKVFKEGSWKLAWISSFASFRTQFLGQRSFVWLDHLKQALSERTGNYERKDDLIDILVETSVINGGPLDLHTLEKLSELVSMELRLIAPTMLFCVFELSNSQHVQIKLRDEVLRNNKAEFSYEYISSNDNYLGRVIRGSNKSVFSKFKTYCDYSFRNITFASN